MAGLFTVLDLSERFENLLRADEKRQQTAESATFLTSKLSSGELTDGVFVGRGCVIDVVADGDSGGVIITVYQRKFVLTM
jgi:hypothetical protein